MTLEEYRHDAERIDFARKVAEGNGWDAAYIQQHLLVSHQGLHVACTSPARRLHVACTSPCTSPCTSCALVALFFDVTMVVTPLAQETDPG